MKAVIAALGAVLTGSLASAPPAPAAPPCAQYNICRYMPDPYNNGPLMPTWEVPGGYGLPGGQPTVCDPQAYRCAPVLPGSGF